MRLDETLCNCCQAIADNLGFSPGIQVEGLTSEPCWWMLWDGVCERCRDKMASVCATAHVWDAKGADKDLDDLEKLL